MADSTAIYYALVPMDPTESAFGLYRLPQPSPTEPTPGIGSAFGYAFRLLKTNPGLVLTLAALQIVPLLGPLVMAGMMAWLFQRLVRRDERPVPTLRMEDVGTLIRRGLPGFLATLAYGVLMAIAVMVPLFALPVMVIFNDPGASIVFGIFLALGTLGTYLFASVLWYAGVTRAEATEDVDEVFAPAAVWDYGRRTWPRFVMGMVAMGLVAIPLVLVGLTFFFVGIYVAFVLLSLAGLHYRWQVYERYLWEGGTALTLAGTPQE